MSYAAWAKTATCLLAGGSLGYLLAAPESLAVSLPLAGGSVLVWAALQWKTSPGKHGDRLQQELLLNENRYRSLVQATAAIVWRTGASGDFDTPQPEWSAFTGQSFEEYAGRKWLGAVHPDDRAMVSRQWNAALAKRCTYQTEYRLREKSGRYHQMLARSVPVMSDDGRLLEWVGVHVDVTEQRRAERVLAEEERHLQRVLDALPTFVGVLTPDGTLVSSNMAPLKAAAILEEDVVGRPFWDTYWWNWSPRVQDELKNAIARCRAGESVRYDTEVRIADGELTALELYIAPMRDDSGGVSHLIASGVNISDRRRAEMSLNEREQFYRQLIESMPLLMWTWLPDGTCDYVCDRWQKFVGQAIEPTVFGAMDEVHPDDRGPLRLAWREGLEGGRPFQVEIRLRRNDGVFRWFACYATPIRSSRGQVTKWCGAGIDINDRKQMEEALRASETRTRALNSSLEQRVRERTRELVERTDQLRALALDLSETESRERKRLAQVLHDHFQQLVSAAKLKAGLLRRSIGAEQHVQSLRQIESLLEEAIIASRSVATQLSPPVLHDAGLVAAMEWLVRRMELDHQLSIDMSVEGCCEPDNEQVRMIVFECIREILFNVRKHAGVDSASLSLRLLPENLLLVEVADKGVGFEPVKLERRKAADMSFGLFSIRERMSLIGGLLKIESKPGEGTRVSLSVPCIPRVPRTAEPAAAAPASVPRPMPSTGSRLRVLVADDHALFREGLVALLAQEPYLEVIGQAADGEEAVRMARELRPDLMIVDVSMPKASGVQVTAIVCKELPGTRVIGLSMYEQEDMAKSMRDAGAIAYFAKSGAPEDTLLAMLRNLAPPQPVPAAPQQPEPAAPVHSTG